MYEASSFTRNQNTKQIPLSGPVASSFVLVYLVAAIVLERS
jgi:hypothetical protein